MTPKRAHAASAFAALAFLVSAHDVKAQPDVSTVSIRVQHIKGCEKLYYPSARGRTSAETDTHRMETVTTRGGGFIGVINSVERAMSESRDGARHTRDELVAAGYSPSSGEQGNVLTKNFTVTRRVAVEVCIKPGFSGESMTLEARSFDLALQTNTEPDNLLQYASGATTERVRAANRELETEARAAIERLIAGINKTTMPLSDLEMVQMFGSNGIAKQVAFSFSGESHSTTVKLRRVLN